MKTEKTVIFIVKNKNNESFGIFANYKCAEEHAQYLANIYKEKFYLAKYKEDDEHMILYVKNSTQIIKPKN